MAKEVKQIGSGLADLTKGMWNDIAKPYFSWQQGELDKVGAQIGDELGIPRDWKKKLNPFSGGPAPAPAAAPQEAMPQMDAEAIARARRLAALKASGAGRAGTFLGGAGLGNG